MNPLSCVVAAAVIVSSGCGDMKSRGTGGDDCRTIPKDIKGLVVDGPRPRRNVIENLAPIICNWRKQCKADNRTDLKGVITLRLVVDKVGDIGLLGYESTVKDSAYIEQLVSGLYVLDFDPWNDRPEETKIEVPVALMR